MLKNNNITDINICKQKVNFALHKVNFIFNLDFDVENNVKCT